MKIELTLYNAELDIEHSESRDVVTGELLFRHPALVLLPSEDIQTEYYEILIHNVMKGDPGRDAPVHPYLSIERLCHYLYRVTFDSLPEDNGGSSPIGGGCSSYVTDGKLYTNLDWGYDETAEFIVRTRDFEGVSFVGGLNDGHMDDGLIAQLPYRVRDGINSYGIKVSTHVLFNDWQWTGCGERSINITRLPFLVLTKVKSMATLQSDLAGVLDNLYAPEALLAMGYVIQFIVTDGTTVDELKAITGYDASATQVLKNVNGTIQWVTE